MADWIEIKEGCEMPHDFNLVWVFLPVEGYARAKITKGTWNGRQWFSSGTCRRFQRHITFWMPISSENPPLSPGYE